MITRYYEDEFVTLYHGNNIEVLPALNVGDMPWIDAVITDPPYGLSFMGKKWDYDVPGVETWRAVVDLMKPGAHLLSFFGTRTYHRGVCQIEDAGLDIRDQIGWLYGSGFPKSLDVSKAIDKSAGAEREITGEDPNHIRRKKNVGIVAGQAQYDLETEDRKVFLTVPATDDAKRWSGWGTALKPSHENICMARKPFEGTVAQNVMEYGTGALNIDGSRVGTESRKVMIRATDDRVAAAISFESAGSSWKGELTSKGRFPTNLIHDGSDEVLEAFAKFGERAPSTARILRSTKSIGYGGSDVESCTRSYEDKGTAARFFKSCPQDEECTHCLLPYAKARNTIDEWKNLLAQPAEKIGWTTQATNEFTVLVYATAKANEQLALNVKSAGKTCGSCATSIAVVLVGIKTLGFKQEESLLILDSTGNFDNSILNRNLVSFAEMWESIDTIPTTTSLLILFGYARHATENYIKKENKDQEAEGRGQVKETRFLYTSKASRKERGEGNNHPTVKPLALMRYLIGLVTPPGGIILDPFAGSGTTLLAAQQMGVSAVGIEQSEEYCQIIVNRLRQGVFRGGVGQTGYFNRSK